MKNRDVCMVLVGWALFGLGWTVNPYFLGVGTGVFLYSTVIMVTEFWFKS